MAQKSSDTLLTYIEYHSTDPYYTYTMYNPADMHWDVLNDIISSYYLCYYQIFGLNGLPVLPVARPFAAVPLVGVGFVFIQVKDLDDDMVFVTGLLGWISFSKSVLICFVIE